MLAYVPKPPNNPSISQHDYDTGVNDTHIKNATEEEEEAIPRQSKIDPKDATAKNELSVSQPT